MSKQSSTPLRRLLRLGKFVAQIGLLGLVAWGIWRTIGQARNELADSHVELGQLQSGWLATAALFYFIGMLPWGWFWHQVLLAMGQRPRQWDSFRAYFVSQPGKYVPGKFMVVAVRSAMIRGRHVDFTLAAASCIVETLTIISIGAVIGAALVPLAVPGDWRLAAFAVISAGGVGLPVLPPVFRRLVKLTRLHRLHPEIDRSLEGLSITRLAPGWGAIACGWAAMGVSLWATLQAIPTHLERGIGIADLPLVTACAALSLVAGFVSGLPGGLGAREFVVMELLKPHFGATAAILSAVIHRCVMLGAELLACGIMLALPRRRTSDAE